MPRPREKPSGRAIDLRALEQALSSDQAWAARHLPLIRGAISIAEEDQRALRRRCAALGNDGSAIVRERIDLLETRLDHLQDLVAVLRRARTRLSRLVRSPRRHALSIAEQVEPDSALPCPTAPRQIAAR